MAGDFDVTTHSIDEFLKCHSKQLTAKQRKEIKRINSVDYCWKGFDLEYPTVRHTINRVAVATFENRKLDFTFIIRFLI